MSAGPSKALGLAARVRLNRGMKSCFGLLLVLLVLTAVIGGGALLWYLSDSAEFSRKDGRSAPAAAGDGR